MDYGVTKFEKLLCAVIRHLRGTKKMPNYIIKKSRKKYGYLDSLARFFLISIVAYLLVNIHMAISNSLMVISKE